MVQTIETYDATTTQRPVVYGAPRTEVEETKDVAEATNTDPDKPGLERLKIVAGDLIDIWLFEGQKGLDFVQASKAFQYTQDQYKRYRELFDSIKSKSQQLADTVRTTVSQNLESLNQKVVFFYDEASSFVGMLISVLRERQSELVDYIQRTYSNVRVFIQDNWVRLDFNADGILSAEELRKNLQDFYRFLVNFHYIEETMRISSSLYDEAKKMLKREQQSQQASSPKEPKEEGSSERKEKMD